MWHSSLRLSEKQRVAPFIRIPYNICSVALRMKCRIHLIHGIRSTRSSVGSVEKARYDFKHSENNRADYQKGRHESFQQTLTANIISFKICWTLAVPLKACLFIRLVISCSIIKIIWDGPTFTLSLWLWRRWERKRADNKWLQVRECRHLAR